MLDKVTIAYRGGTYEIGRGRDYFGIWTVAGSRSQPLEWWPETQEGWSAAWTRFAVLEAPDGITPVGQAATRPGEPASAGWAPATAAGRGGAMAAALLLGVGVALGIAGLFPDYLGGSSLAAQPDTLFAHVIYLATWTTAGVLIALGGARLRVGALLATGLSIVTFGLFLADAGTPISGGAYLAGAGLVLSLLGWLACAAGSVLAFLIRPARTASPAPDTADQAATPTRLFSLGWPRGATLGPAVLLVLAGLGTAAAFVPSWDSFTLRTAAGQSQTFTAGNAFNDPGPVIAGNVVVMVALAAIVIAAALWRPARHGAVLLAGAIIPMAAQAVSALIGAAQATSPTQFGFTPAQASRLGLTISNGLTSSFWIYSVLVVVLLVSCAWMLFTPPAPAPAPVPAGAWVADDADTQVPTWHVARADAYDLPGVGTQGLQEHDWEAGGDTGNDEFDSHEEFDSDSPSDSIAAPHVRPDQPGGAD